MTDNLPPVKDERFDRRYRVVFNDGTRKPKQIIVRFLQEVKDEYVFDARPLSGTIRLGVHDVQAMIETEMPLQPWPRVVGTSWH
jgi:hypothetical protein